MTGPFLALPLVVLAQLALPPLPEAPARPVFVPAPAPSPPPGPGTELYEAQRSTRERELRRECYSEAGIRLIMEHWVRARTMAPETRAAIEAAELELAEAAYAEPIDIDRLERAIHARTLVQTEVEIGRADERVTLLRSLPAADQAIYVKGFTPKRTSQAELTRSCPIIGAGRRGSPHR